jgi:hypothetical protein
MTKKIFSFAVLMMLIVAFAGFTTQKASADASFPAGCSSALGYSVTTGSPCNGTATATVGFLPGCSTALGYSVTNGAPCSGSSVAIQYLAGCTATTGYSTITGAPCNGTTVADPVISVPTTPGLPTTGAGGNAPWNVVSLVCSGLAVLGGALYLVRRTYTA